MVISRRFQIVALLLSCGASAVTLPAAARRQRELPYAFRQVWSTALRLVRVDLELPVTDRDAEGGYVLFEYVAGDKRHAGSIELASQGERVATVAIVRVQGQPSYVEQMILDKLEKKLRAELGAPPPAERPKPPSRGDAGAPDAGEAG